MLSIAEERTHHLGMVGFHFSICKCTRANRSSPSLSPSLCLVPLVVFVSEPDSLSPTAAPTSHPAAAPEASGTEQQQSAERAWPAAPGTPRQLAAAAGGCVRAAFRDRS